MEDITLLSATRNRRGMPVWPTSIPKPHRLNQNRRPPQWYALAKKRQSCCRHDTGSQKSYLTERAMKMLKLEPTGKQTLSIAAFGATQGQSRVCPLVSLGVCLKGYPNMPLSLHVVSTICEPLSCQPVTASIESHGQLMSLDLAESADADSHLPVDILIGCDQYWELVTGGIRR